MADINIQGDNKGIVVGGDMTIKELIFEPGKGIKAVSVITADDIEDAEIIPSTPKDAVAEAIRYVMNLKDENRNYVFSMKSQWYGIYRILADRHIIIPNEFTRFGQYINDLDIENPRIELNARELSKYNRGNLVSPFSRWDEEPPASSIQYQRIRKVATQFKDKLDELLPE